MTNLSIDANTVDVIAWIVWTLIIALIFYFIGHYIGFQHGFDVGYMNAYSDYIKSIGV